MNEFDNLISQNPLLIVPPHNLVNDTFSSIASAQKRRSWEKFIGLIVMLTLFLFLAKWRHNDIAYLVQALFYHFSVVSSQRILYFSAILESIPKLQFLALCISGSLWVIWRIAETFFIPSRIKGMRNNLHVLNVTQKLVMVSAILSICTVGAASYSYAQKNEQKKLELLRAYINQTGRKEFETNPEAGECGMVGQNYINQYEVKKSAQVTQVEAEQIIEAYCNSSAAEKFLLEHFFPQNNPGNLFGSASMPYLVEERRGNELSVQDHQKFVLTAMTKVYKDTQLVTLDDVHKDDIVMFVVQPDEVIHTLLGVYILPKKLDFEWYNPTLQHSITQIQTCAGNPLDRCSFTGSIDLFPSGGGESNSRNAHLVQNSTDAFKEIAGILIEISDEFIKIQSSSGRIFTVNFGSNPITTFNLYQSGNYENKKIGLGDTVLIRYFEPEERHDTTILRSQIFNAVLMLEIINKTDVIQKY